MANANTIENDDGKGETRSIFCRNHNRDLISKKGKIDWRSRLRVTMGEEKPGSSTFSVVHCGGDVEFTDGEVEHGD